MRRWWALTVVVAWVAIGGTAIRAAAMPRPATTPRQAADCTSLGPAAGFVAFSHGDFVASPPGGENITGRVAAAHDVTIDGPGSGGVFVSPAAGDPAPTVIAGHDLSLGQSGAGGSLSGGARYGNAGTVAPNFTVSGGVIQGDPGITFDDAFEALRTLSSSLADLGQTAGATVSLNQYSHALELTGTGNGLNVFTVSAAQLAEAAGVIITLTQPGASALINVTTDTDLVVSPQYENLSGVTAANVAWNLPLATGLTIGGSADWQGMVLAPNAAVTMQSNGQFHGQVIAANIPAASRTLTKVAFTGCLPAPPPPTPPDESLTLGALCAKANGDLTMRLRNTGDQARTGTWVNTGGTDFGQFSVPAHNDLFFDVDHPVAGSVVSVTSGTTRVTAPVTLAPCQGQITVRLVTVGPAPAGATWDVGLENGNGSVPVVTLGSGQQQTQTVAGGYVNGAAPIDQVIGGVAYTVSVPDTHGGAATVSLNPIEILDGQDELVTVTITFAEPGGPENPNIEAPPAPEQPTLPPGAPNPLPGPDLESSASGTDLSITHQLTPHHVTLGGVVTAVTRVRNVGHTAAVGVVAREIPQFHPAQANSVARVLSISTTRGRCTSFRPVHCSLGTLAPGASVTIRTRARPLVAATLRSVVVVSSDTPETNTTNNIAIGRVTAIAPAPRIGVHIAATPLVHVGQRVRYRVTVTGGGGAGADSVRLCTRPPASLVGVRAPGTTAYRGQRCRTANHLGRGHSMSLTVTGSASAKGHLLPSGQATAVDVPRPARATAHVRVIGPLVACPAAVRAIVSGHGPPRARAAC